MKISITVSELSESQAAEVLKKLSGNVEVVQEQEEENESETVSNDNVAGVVDARGLPWDERIHSGNKKLTDKGVWQKRRGVQQAEIDRVEAELRSAPAPMTAPATFTAPVAPTAAFTPPAFVPPQATFTPPAPVQQTHDFQSLMATVSSLFASGAINPDYLTTLTSRIGQAFQVNVTAITDLASNVQMVDYAFTLLKQDGKIN